MLKSVGKLASFAKRANSATVAVSKAAAPTVRGISHAASSTVSLAGSFIKGLSASITASVAFIQAMSAADAQRSLSDAESAYNFIESSREARVIARSAEAAPPTASELSVDNPRLLAQGRGPVVTVNGMVQGDIDTAVAMFDRFGYMVNRSMVPPRLDVMEKRSFWQFQDPTILGAMPAEARESISDALERGTTVWTSVSQIGTQGTNNPRSGISY